MRLLASFLIIGASPAFSATTPVPTVPMLDPIGTGCIDGGGYDDPFPSSKGVRAPAFCVFNPCNRALTRVELSRDIIGRDVEDWEWDAYYSRYAELCRADAVNRDAPSGPVTAEAFWAPLLAPPLISYLGGSAGPGGSTGLVPSQGNGGGIDFLPGGVGGGGGVLPGNGGGREPSPNGGNAGTTPGGGNSDNTPGGVTPDGGSSGGGGTSGDGGSGGPETPPPVIPLPTTWALLMSALVAAAAVGRAKRS